MGFLPVREYAQLWRKMECLFHTPFCLEFKVLFGAGSLRRSASRPIAIVTDGRVKTSSLFTAADDADRGAEVDLGIAGTESGERLAQCSHEPKVTAEWGGLGHDASRRLQARTRIRAKRVRCAHKSVVLPDRIPRLFLHPIPLNPDRQAIASPKDRARLRRRAVVAAVPALADGRNRQPATSGPLSFFGLLYSYA
jgi:hypothetical protein